jgi:hypothetical protein
MIWFVTNFVLYAVLYFLARQWSSRVRFVSWLIIAILSAILFLPAVLYSFYYLHFFDGWCYFYQFRSHSVSNLYPSTLGWVAGLLYSISDRTCLKKYLYIVFIFFVLCPYLKIILTPLDSSTLQDRWNDGVCLQTSESTCGPASVATILTNAFNDRVTEQIVAASSYSTKTGTEIWYLAQYLRSKGYLVAFHTHSNGPYDCSVAGVNYGGFGHFVAVIDCQAGNCRIADPMYGNLSPKQVQYLPSTGFFMVIRKAV